MHANHSISERFDDYPQHEPLAFPSSTTKDFLFGGIPLTPNSTSPLPKAKRASPPPPAPAGGLAPALQSRFHALLDDAGRGTFTNIAVTRWFGTGGPWPTHGRGFTRTQKKGCKKEGGGSGNLEPQRDAPTLGNTEPVPTSPPPESCQGGGEHGKLSGGPVRPKMSGDIFPEGGVFLCLFRP